MSKVLLSIEELTAEIEGKSVLNGVNLSLKAGQVHAIMGRNGAGKTSLSNVLMGHPKYKVTRGKIMLDGVDISSLPPEERAKARLFLAFQHPVAIPGVTVASFLRAALKAVRGSELEPQSFRALIKAELKVLGIPETFMTRSMNDGFSGGEKKRLETLQLRLLQPKVVVLDETDSGLDIDALRDVVGNIEQFRSEARAMLVITHYQRMLDVLKPDVVHVLSEGRIVRSGGPELARELETRGYDWVSA